MIVVRRRAAAAAVAVLAATGCAGPQVAVTIGGKSLPIDVAFGQPAPDTVPPPPKGAGPTTLVPLPNGVGVLPVPDSGRPTKPRAVPTVLPPCPDPVEGRYGEVAATNVVRGVPEEKSYLAQVSGVFTDGDRKRLVDTVATHTVTNAQLVDSAAGPAATFDVVVASIGARATYSYVVTPGTYTASGVPTGGMIALRAVTGDGGLGYEASFRPDLPLQLFAQPAARGVSWTGANTDARSGTVVTVTGELAGKASVNVCGTLVDTWRSTATITSKSANQDVVATVETYFATGNGGLPIRQVQSYSGTAGGKKVSGSLTWFLMSVPEAS